jgi:hypothetical protein
MTDTPGVHTMMPELDELARLVGRMPPELAREVLNFAHFLELKHSHGTEDLPDWDDGSRYGLNLDAELAAAQAFEQWEERQEQRAS